MPYKTKMMTVDAVQVKPNNDLEISSFMETTELKYRALPGIEAFAILIETEAGQVAAIEGDYIVKTESGKIIPIRENAFTELFRESKI